MKQPLKLQVKRLNENAILPTRAQFDDAGLDLYSSDSVFIPYGSSGKIPTGISVATPSGTYIQIADRSSMAVKGLRTGAGVVDSQFRGGLTVIIHNLNNATESYIGERGYWVKKGDKIAQMISIPILLPEVEEVSELSETSRGHNGFGSSGR